MSQAGVLSNTGGGGGTPATSFVEDIGTATPDGSGVINVLGGVGITTSGSGNTITITNTSPGTSFTWQIVTSANNPVNMVTQNGYITKGAGVVDLVLPAGAGVGDTFRIIGYGNLWTIAQNAGQSIRLGSAISTAGVGGSISASMVTDCLDIICVTTNFEFFCDVIQGNPIIV